VCAGNVDGVPVFWIPGVTSDDEYVAGLVFRVGRVDETLATSGITHLIEHLVLHSLGADDTKHVNGHTEALTTTFVTRGSADEIASFFHTVTAGLRELPSERIEHEKRVLRAEGASSKPSTSEVILRHRYGTEGYGLLSFPEMGLDAAGPGELAAWVNRGFTRGNAALWLAGGPPPARLRLDLPDGGRMPVPAMPVTIRSSPAYFNANVAGPGFCGLVRRSTAAQVYGMILPARLNAELRHKQALSYSPSAVYSVRDGKYAHILAGADGVDGSVAILVSEFIRMIARLRDKPVDDVDLKSVADRMITTWESPRSRLSQAQRAAQNELLGRENNTVETWKDQLAAVSPEDVQRVAAEAFDNGVFALPRGQEPFRAEIRHVPWFSSSTVAGHHARSADAPFVSTRLILGTEGVSIGDADHALTVRYDQCAAVRVWSDGARQLIGADGISVIVEPTLWHLPSGAISRIDASVPRERHVTMPYRERNQIPHPGTTTGMRILGRALKEPLAATAITLVFVVGLPLLIGQFSATAGLVTGGIMLLTVFTSLSIMREMRARLWLAAAKRASGVEPPPDFG
jgi:zinc protease